METSGAQSPDRQDTIVIDGSHKEAATLTYVDMDSPTVRAVRTHYDRLRAGGQHDPVYVQSSSEEATMARAGNAAKDSAGEGANSASGVNSTTNSNSEDSRQDTGYRQETGRQQ